MVMFCIRASFMGRYLLSVLAAEEKASCCHETTALPRVVRIGFHVFRRSLPLIRISFPFLRPSWQYHKW